MTGLVWQVILAAFFFAGSMVFSASETALVSLSRPRLKKLISQRLELADAFTVIPADDNPASAWFLSLSLGLFLLVSSLLALLIVRALRPFW